MLEDFSWFLLKPIINFTKLRSKKSLTIGITTFMNRFDSCLKPLLNKVALLFPEAQVVVIANGHVLNTEQNIYLKKITEYSKGFNNVQLISYKKPKGLSYLWNQIIRNAKYDNILILNDDLKIMLRFINYAESRALLESSIATINFSWSHFIISKEIVAKNGLFDEELIEIGGEDDDYAARLAINKISVSNFSTNTIAPKLNRDSSKLKFNTYGKDMTKEIGGYSSYNTEYLKKKWQSSRYYIEGAVEVPNRKIRYWKLK